VKRLQPRSPPAAPESPYARHWERLVTQKREILVLVEALLKARVWDRGGSPLLIQRMTGLAEYGAGLTMVLEWLQRAGREAEPPVRHVDELPWLVHIGAELRALVLGAVPAELRAAVFEALGLATVPRRDVLERVANIGRTRRCRPEREVPGMRRIRHALAVAYGSKRLPGTRARDVPGATP